MGSKAIKVQAEKETIKANYFVINAETILY